MKTLLRRLALFLFGADPVPVRKRIAGILIVVVSGYLSFSIFVFATLLGMGGCITPVIVGSFFSVASAYLILVGIGVFRGRQEIKKWALKIWY